MTEQDLLENLDSYREFTIKVDANLLVDKTIKHWKFIKDLIKQDYSKELVTPEVSFSSNEIEYLQMDLSWDKKEHYLCIEIFEGRTNTYAYYVNENTKEELSYSYNLDKPLPNELLNKLLLFTE